jgi:uncharacterized membrane protein
VKHEVIAWATQLPAPVATVILAALPILELRGSLPYALTLGGLPVVPAYALSVLGNFLPVPFFLAFLGRLEKALRRYGPFDRFFRWLFARTRRKAGVVERYGAFGLVLFVAVPLPVTGAWTGVVAAYLFNVPARRAAPAILLGICIAGIVVTLAVQGVIQLW